MFLYKVFNKFFRSHANQNDHVLENGKFILFDIPYEGISSHRFIKNIPWLILKLSFRKLKSRTSLSLVFSVVYRFTCPCDTGKACIGMSSRHLVTITGKYLKLVNCRKSAIKDCNSESLVLGLKSIWTRHLHFQRNVH